MTMRQTIALEELPGALDGLQSGAVPGYLDELKRAVLVEEWTAEDLATRVLTRTYQSSEVPFEGDPRAYARDLPYQEGHRPPGRAEREAVVAAAGPFGVVGSANDARHNGIPYGIHIEAADRLHEQAHRDALAVLRAYSQEAWRRATGAA